MKCIFCKADTRVTDKRESPEGTRRRRECLKCKKRFTTYEKSDKKDIMVVKKDNRREAFSRDKIKSGIIKACEKRPVSIIKIDKIIDEIEEKLRNSKNFSKKNFGATKSIKDFAGKDKEVKSEIIGNMIMNRLKKLDKVAYIRFASVYRDFKDVSDFKKEIKEL